MTSPKLAVAASGYGGRGYRHPINKTLKVPGVTTILKVLDKPAVHQWAVDQTSAFAVANIDYLLSCTQLQGYNGLRWYWKRTPDLAASELRNFHVGVLNDAAELGTAVHQWIQVDLGVSDDFYPEVDSPEMEQMVEAWLEFKFEHDITAHWSERTLWNHTHGYAGTADLLWDIDDQENQLCDIKSARSIWDDHLMQIAALYNCETELPEVEENVWEENEFVKPASLSFLHIRPDDVANDGTPIPAYCELVQVDMARVPVYFEMFLGALQVAKARRAIKDLDKESKGES